MTPQQFRAIRDQLKLSQWELGEALGYRPNVISRAETGKCPISKKMAQRLLAFARIVGTCPECLGPWPIIEVVPTIGHISPADDAPQHASRGAQI